MYEALINAITEARKGIRANIREPLVKANVNNISHAGWGTICYLLHCLECDAEEARKIAQYKATREVTSNEHS